MLIDGAHAHVKGSALAHWRRPFGFGADPYLAT
jgi:hypothetical protein